MTDERTAKVNALVALTRSVDLEIDARQTLTPEQMTTVAHWRTRNEDLAVSTARTEATRLAKRITALDGELKDNHARMTEILESTPAAGLLERNRGRTSQRRSRLYGLVSSGASSFRGGIRCFGWSQPDPCIIGKYCQTPPQSRRRSAAQQRPAHGRRRANGS
jgi:hypothetical protein